MTKESKGSNIDLGAKTENQSSGQTTALANSNKFDYYSDDVLTRPREKKENFGTMSARMQLQTPQRKGFVRQWVIDNEMYLYESRDWRPVKGEDGNPMRAILNRKKDKPDYGTYMEIPEIYYQENVKMDDQQRKIRKESRAPTKEGKEIDGQVFVQPSDIPVDYVRQTTLKNN